MRKGQVSIILKMIATLCVVPLVLSLFSNGFSIVSSGVTINPPVNVSIFSYISEGNVLLAFSFVSVILMIILIFAVIILSIVSIYKSYNNTYLNILLNGLIIALGILQFVCTLVYCVSNSMIDVMSSLKYSLGFCCISYLVFGIIFGTLHIVSYFIKD